MGNSKHNRIPSGHGQSVSAGHALNESLSTAMSEFHFHLLTQPFLRPIELSIQSFLVCHIILVIQGL